jgi:SAM-dependent methyltransferase
MAKNQQKPSEQVVALLAELVSSRPEETMRRDALYETDLGAFLRDYAALPSPVNLDPRSSIREDIVVGELSRLLKEREGMVKVVDACCGTGVLARRILLSLPEHAQRIHFVAFDGDKDCVRLVCAQDDEFRAFNSFRCLLRDVCDGARLDIDNVDLVVLNNSLHEIPPRFYPEMFEALNTLLAPDRGQICIVDMEELPPEEPEAIAIPWNLAEVESILKAGGFKPWASPHEKLVPVYQTHIGRVQKVDGRAMKETIQQILRRKLEEAIKARRRIEANLLSGNDLHREWIVATGFVARCADEMLALGFSPR